MKSTQTAFAVTLMLVLFSAGAIAGSKADLQRPQWLMKAENAWKECVPRGVLGPVQQKIPPIKKDPRITYQEVPQGMIPYVLRRYNNSGLKSFFQADRMFTAKNKSNVGFLGFIRNNCLYWAQPFPVKMLEKFMLDVGRDMSRDRLKKISI